MQMRGETRGALDGGKIAAVGIAAERVLQKHIKTVRAPSSPGRQVSRMPPDQSGFVGRSFQSARWSLETFFVIGLIVLGAGKGADGVPARQGAPEGRVDFEGIAGLGAHLPRFTKHSAGVAFDLDSGACKPLLDAVFLGSRPGFVGAREVNRSSADLPGDRCQNLFGVATAQNQRRTQFG